VNAAYNNREISAEAIAKVTINTLTFKRRQDELLKFKESNKNDEAAA